MELALICLKQVAQLFILMGIGVIMDKTKIIDDNGKKLLSSILIKIAVPCLIISSYIGTSGDNVSSNITLSFLYSFIVLLIGIIISIVTARFVKQDNRGTYKFACSFSNAAYMGFPLIRAMIGEEGIIYASSYVTVFNILLWTIGNSYFSNDKNSLKSLLKNLLTCPPIIAVIVGLIIYFFKIPVVDIIATPLDNVGSMTTPLSMIIIGITISKSDLKQLFKNGEIYFGILIRLIIIPILSLLIIKLFNVPEIVRNVVLILHACPAAAITSLLAIEHKKDEQYAAGIVVISTIFSIISLPLYTYLLTLI